MAGSRTLRRLVIVLPVWITAIGLLVFVYNHLSLSGRQAKSLIGPSPTESKYRHPLNVSQVYLLSASNERALQMHRMLKYANIPYKLMTSSGPYTRWLNETVANADVRKSFDVDWNPHGFPDYFRFTMACTLGHREIFKDALRNSYERILILEDDIDIHRNIKAVLQRALEQEPKDWGILMVGYAVLNKPDQWLNSSPAEIWQPMAYASQSHAYIVKGQYLQLLLEATEDVTLAPIDQILMSLLPASGAFRLYGLKPPLAMQMPMIPSLLSGHTSSWGRGDFGDDGFFSVSRTGLVNG